MSTPSTTIDGAESDSVPLHYLDASALAELIAARKVCRRQCPFPRST